MDPVGYQAWPSPYPLVAGGAVAEGMPPGVFTVTRLWIVIQDEPDEGWITPNRPSAPWPSPCPGGQLARVRHETAAAALEGGDA